MDEDIIGIAIVAALVFLFGAIVPPVFMWFVQLWWGYWLG